MAEEKKIRRGNTKAKNKYNKKTYAQYLFRVRKENILDEQIKNFMEKEGTSLNHLIHKLLEEYFLREEDSL
jgi:predicted HicB family RNase H-like nuclease